MKQLLSVLLTFCVVFVSILKSQPSTTLIIPSNSTTQPPYNQFELCNRLKLSGCAVTEINSLVRLLVDNEMKEYDYKLPTNPCKYDTINMTWILAVTDLEDYFPQLDNAAIVNGTPCEIWIQLNDELTERDLLQMRNETYWFDANNGKCKFNANNVLNCSQPQSTISNSLDLYAQCPLPFVKSSYKTEFLTSDFGEEFAFCGIPCEVYFYSGDIQMLDNFNTASVWISLLFIIGFFINVSLEFKNKVYICHATAKKKRLSELPLTFDIPLVIAAYLVLVLMVVLVETIAGKNYFSCETGATGQAMSMSPISETNIHCYMAGSFMYLGLASVFFYFSLLSFSIWNTLYNPLKPLFGLHKYYFHAFVHLISLSFWIASLVDEAYGTINILGICGPAMTGDTGLFYVILPLCIAFSAFIIFTPLSIYKIWTHLQKNKKQLQSSMTKSIINLSIRLVVYSCFVIAAFSCFLYTSSQFVFLSDFWIGHYTDYLECGVVNEGDLTRCEEFLETDINEDVYFMQGILMLLISIASFALSCSNTRYRDYDGMVSVIRRKTIDTMSKRSRKSTASSGNGTGSHCHNTGEHSSNSKKKNETKMSNIDMSMMSQTIASGHNAVGVHVPPGTTPKMNRVGSNSEFQD